jgi:putative MATE family efflux protein
MDARSLRRTVLGLALPVIAGQLVMLGYHWLNSYWVGRYDLGASGGRNAGQAALSIATFLVWAHNSVAQVLVVGLAALVGRYVGAGRLPAARYVGLQGVRWAWVLAAGVAAVGWPLAPAVFSATGASAEAARMGTDYVRVWYLASFAPMTVCACEAVFRANGNTRTPFVVSSAGLVLNAVLDPVLIFGLGPAPALGPAGSAVATAISLAVTALVELALLRRANLLSRDRPSEEELRIHETTPLHPGTWPGLDASIARRLARIGLPTVVSGLLFVGVYLAMSWTVTEAGGDAAQAGLGVGIRGEGVAYVLCQGFNAAATVLVGTRLGANRPDEAARAAWTSVRLASVACLAWAILLAALARPLSAFFVGPGDAREHAVAYYRIVSLCLVPQSWEIVLDGAFGGAGMTVPPMVVSLVVTLLRVPLAPIAAFDLGLGVAGIWWVIAATAAARGVLLSLWFARGSWKTRTV